LEARSSARLGNAMLNEDYAGVESVIEMLIPEITTGDSSERIRQNYEVALKWLSRNEPPPPDDNEDQEEPGDNEDQEEPEDDEEDQPPPPGESEMTPEVAQMILDMVEEAQADTTAGSVGEAIGVPNW
ncbi:MAG: hypothetical protein KAS73_08725, partial [Candidatus Sabulitectum sp.]|nr:hypothetical protein [Candidatus Sabulitectum sp.]